MPRTHERAAATTADRMGLNGDRGDRIGERESRSSFSHQRARTVLRARASFPRARVQRRWLVRPSARKKEAKLADAEARKRKGSKTKRAASRDNGPTINQWRANVRRKRFGQQKLCAKHSVPTRQRTREAKEKEKREKGKKKKSQRRKIERERGRRRKRALQRGPALPLIFYISRFVSIGIGAPRRY